MKKAAEALADVLDRIIVYIIYGLILLLPIFAFPGFGNPYLTNKAVLLRVATAVLLLLWAASCALARELKWRRTPLDIPLAGLLAAGVVSTIFSMNRLATLAGSIRLEGLWAYFMYALLFYLAAWYLGDLGRCRDNNNRWLTALRLFALSSALPALMSILQLFGVDLSKLYKAELMTYSATFGNRAFYACYLVLIIPVFAYLAYLSYKEKKTWLRIAWAAGAAVNLFMLVLSNNRGALLGLIIAAVAAVVMTSLRSPSPSPSPSPDKSTTPSPSPDKSTTPGPSRRRVILIGLGAVILIVLILFGAAWGTSYGQRLRSAITLSDDTSKSRLYMWESAVKMIADRPIQGYGLESYYYDSLRYTEPELNELYQSNPDYKGKNVLANSPHNQTLYMGVSLGLAGIFFYLLINGVLLWCLYRGFRRSKSKDDAWFYGAVFCAVLAYFISVQFLWDLPPFTFYFWVLAGAALGRLGRAEAGSEETAQEALEPPKSPKPPEPPRKTLPAVLVWAGVTLVAVAAITASVYAVRVQLADRYAYNASKQMPAQTVSPQSVGPVVEELKHAYSLDPLNHDVGDTLATLMLVQAQGDHTTTKAWKVVDLAEELHGYYPTSPWPYAFTGMAYAIAYDFEGTPAYKQKATENLNEALELNPYFQSARTILNNLNKK